MSAKNIFRSLQVILWLTLHFSLLAQPPQRTKPTSATAEENRPCWEQEIKQEVSLANKNCYAQFLKEVDKQIKAEVDQQVLESFELAGVRFVKAMGISEKSAAEIVAKHFTELELRNVLKVPNQNQETVRFAEVKPTPTVSEETPRQAALFDRTEASARKKLLREERREGWKVGLPQPEKSTGNCWEETHPKDLVGCIAQLQQFINQVKVDTALAAEERKLAVKNLEVDKKKLKKLLESAEKGLSTQRTWATSRSKSFLTGCSGTWVSEDNAGPGSQWNPSVTLTIVNNTGMDIKTISLSDRGPIVENLCVGGSVVIHRGWNGSMNGQNFSFMAIAEVMEGGTPRKYLWKLPTSIYPNGTPQSTDWILTRETRQPMGYY